MKIFNCFIDLVAEVFFSIFSDILMIILISIQVFFLVNNVYAKLYEEKEREMFIGVFLNVFN